MSGAAACAVRWQAARRRAESPPRRRQRRQGPTAPAPGHYTARIMEQPPDEIQTAREYRKNKLERDERERMAIAARRRRMLRNPWYLAPDEWYKSGADEKNSGDANAPELLPYEIE